MRPLETQLAPLDDRLLQVSTETLRAAKRPAGSVLEPLNALEVEAAQPFMRGCSRAPLGLGSRGDSPSPLPNPLDQQPSTFNGQLRPTMHQSLLCWLVGPFQQGGSHSVNDVCGNYT
jgi:hypothetical protein